MVAWLRSHLITLDLIKGIPHRILRESLMKVVTKRTFVTKSMQNINRRTLTQARKRNPVDIFKDQEIKSQTARILPKARITTNKGRIIKRVKTIRRIGKTANDKSKIPVGARLFRFRAAWEGAHHESVIKKGLSWSWEKGGPPHQKSSIRRPPQIKTDSW